MYTTNLFLKSFNNDKNIHIMQHEKQIQLHDQIKILKLDKKINKNN